MITLSMESWGRLLEIYIMNENLKNKSMKDNLRTIPNYRDHGEVTLNIFIRARNYQLGTLFSR